jgi:SAM-dependent methyltransferase
MVTAALVLSVGLTLPGSCWAQKLPKMETRKSGVLYPNVFDTAFAPASDKQRNILSEDRFRTADFHLLVRALELKPGDSVLDVGAGVGFFAFPMAKAMNNQGVIYASEVDANMLSILDATTPKNGISIIKPLHVSPHGLDPAYKNHRYNKCLVAGVFQDMEDPIDFMRQLLPQFEKNSLVVVVHSEAFAAHPDARTQLPAPSILRAIQDLGPEHPVAARLPPDLRSRLMRAASLAPNDLDEQLHQDTGIWLESVLTDPHLPQDIIRHFTKNFVSWKAHLVEIIDPSKILTVEWMLTRYQAINPDGPLTAEEQYLIRGLNLVLLEQPLFGGPRNGNTLVQSGAAIRLQMEQAGLVFQSEELVNSFFWVLVFRTP